MVKHVTDLTGRFPERPHYTTQQLDQECEKIIYDFLRAKNKKVAFPVDTEDIKLLIERDASDLDCYADLSEYGNDVEGVTIFKIGQKPSVKISSRLTEDGRYENRLRTTLTHEYGHVKFHGYLFNMNSEDRSKTLVSKRENIIGAPQTDWMEWQAGYISGAILMPAFEVRRLVKGISDQTTANLIKCVMNGFQVSEDAARVRLIKLSLIR